MTDSSAAYAAVGGVAEAIVEQANKLAGARVECEMLRRKLEQLQEFVKRQPCTCHVYWVGVMEEKIECERCKALKDSLVMDE